MSMYCSFKIEDFPVSYLEPLQEKYIYTCIYSHVYNDVLSVEFTVIVQLSTVSVPLICLLAYIT